MNEWDRNNLHFILDSDEATLEDFYSWATEDDLAYALSLVRASQNRITGTRSRNLGRTAD
jgi:hypothetical protein